MIMTWNTSLGPPIFGQDHHTAWISVVSDDKGEAEYLVDQFVVVAPGDRMHHVQMCGTTLERVAGRDDPLFSAYARITIFRQPGGRLQRLAIFSEETHH